MTDKQQPRRKPQPKTTEGITFVTEYTHYRTKKRMRAADYGHKAWPFGKRRS